MKSRAEIRRLGIQAAATLAQNPYISNFFNGRISKVSSKEFCVPGLNCYSCPAAAGACPIGALQAVEGSAKYDIAFYVLGLLVLFGIVGGRIICGFLCPFGFLQDLLHRIPIRKCTVPPRVDQPLRWMKYLVLLVLVVGLPILATSTYETSEPFFCKFLCPAGTIEAGIPAVIQNPTIRAMAGRLFGWKALVAIVTVVTSMLIARPFCKYVCPLGAIYSLFNRVSFVRMELDSSKCTACHRCESECPMQVDILRNINSAECIRCGRCRHACHIDAIKWKKGI